MDKIEDNLYLGDITGASNKLGLQKEGITHVLTVASNRRPLFPESFVYKVINVHDVPSTNLLAHFNSAFSFINAAVNEGGIVFVHCFAGASRSATIVIAYLMKERGMSLREAYRFVKSKRCFINPNEGFVKQL